MPIELKTGPVTDPGFYRMTDDVYHADPAPRPSTSAGLLSILINDTPADAKYAHPRLNPPTPQDIEDNDSTNYDLGSTAHALLLGEGRELVVIDANDWRTKAAKEARAEAIAAEKQPVLAKVYDKANEMHEAARRQLADDPENFDAFTNGVPEVSAFAKLPTVGGNIWARARADWLMEDYSRIYDYKTFAPGADADGFVKYLVREGRDIQAPHYQAVFAEVAGISWDAIDFRYVVQCPKPPYVLSVIELGAQTAQWSRDRWQWAMDKWAKCGRAGKFPGHVPRTHYVEAPAYAQTAWELRVQMDAAAERMLAGGEE